MLTDTTYTVEQIAQRYGVSTATVTAWITAGELRAVNVSRSRSSRKPRYRITAAALEAFEAARAPDATPALPRVRRPKPGAGVVRFY
jgi:excisionase family DNA binding protein